MTADDIRQLVNRAEPPRACHCGQRIAWEARRCWSCEARYLWRWRGTEATRLGDLLPDRSKEPSMHRADTSAMRDKALGRKQSAEQKTRMSASVAETKARMRTIDALPCFGDLPVGARFRLVRSIPLGVAVKVTGTQARLIETGRLMALPPNRVILPLKNI